MVLTNSAIYELCKVLQVTQLRFHCRKQMKRTFHVTTAIDKTGWAVVEYFCGQTNELPLSCNSFEVMRDDNSILTSHCNDWGDDDTQRQVGTWGHYPSTTDVDDGRLNSFVAFIGNTSYWHISLIEGLLLCVITDLKYPGYLLAISGKYMYAKLSSRTTTGIFFSAMFYLTNRFSVDVLLFNRLQG